MAAAASRAFTRPGLVFEFMIVVPGYHDPKQNQTPSAAKKKDFVTLVDVAGKEHTINVRANGERLQLGAIAEIELQAGDRLWFRANSSGVTNGTPATLAA